MSLRTLVNDSFKDDAINMLDWAYGKDASYRFLNRLIDGQRVGQAFMNTLFDFDEPEFNRLRCSLVDPFYDSQKMPQALDYLTSK